MKALKIPFVIFVFILLTASCKKVEEFQEGVLTTKKCQTLYSISYGSDRRNQMDISLPKGRTANTPVVILIHGGAWVMGSRTYFSSDIKKFADDGIACATINYRYASERKGIHAAELVNDIRKAIDFISSKSEEWQVSSERFGLAGHSAGGHLAMMTAYTKNDDGKIKACVSWAGPTDLLDDEQLGISGSDEVFKVLVGQTPNSAGGNEAYRNASPFWVVGGNSVPTLLIHGTEDPGVPYSTAVKMQNKLNELGIPNTLHTMSGAYHIWTGNHLKEARTATEDWFQSEL
ncbi:MAG: esterase/lipase [Bacteroidota bacterium]|jgi:acetyl esterase/lipase|nr:esterase/lipase [Bacteroidota bacterium]